MHKALGCIFKKLIKREVAKMKTELTLSDSFKIEDVIDEP